MKNFKISMLFCIMMCNFSHHSIFGTEKRLQLSDQEMISSLQSKPFYKVSPLSLHAVEEASNRSQDIQDFMTHFTWIEEGFNLLRSQGAPIASFYETLDNLLLIDVLDSNNNVIGSQGFEFSDVIDKVIQELFVYMDEPFLYGLLDAVYRFQDQSCLSWHDLDENYHSENETVDKIFHYVLTYKNSFLKNEVNRLISKWFESNGELLLYNFIDHKNFNKIIQLLNLPPDNLFIDHLQHAEQDISLIINQPDENGLTPLDYATMSHNLPLIDTLLYMGAYIPVRDGYTNALHIAVFNGYEKIIDRLLSSNPKIVNTRDALQKTPLDIAVEHGYYDIAKKLLERCANQNISADDNGIEFPLFIAVTSDPISLDMIELLLNFGAEIDNRVDDQGISLLGYALNDVAIVRLLLQSGADVNLPDLDEDGFIEIPLLHKAVLNKNIPVIHTLLNYRAEINAQGGITGGTALHEAVELGDKKIVAALLQYDPDRSLVDGQGLTPYQVAKFKLDNLKKDVDKAVKMKSSDEVTQVEDEIKDMLAIIALLS